jgi:hypothetical protein
MFALLRGLRRTRRPALFGAVGWGFGGYLLSTTNLLPILFAVAVLPLVILFAVRLVRAPRPLDVAGLAVSFGAVCLAGEPSTLLATPPLVAAAVLAVRPGAAGRRVPLVAAGWCWGRRWRPARCLPGAAPRAKTRRAAGLAAAVVDQWSMPPVRIGRAVRPQPARPRRRAEPGRYWGARSYPVREFPYLYSLYPGLLCSLLAACVAPAPAVALVALAGAGFLVALGSHLPIWGLLRHLPLVSGIRFPEKFALLVVFPVTVVAAHGFDRVLQGTRRARRPLFWALVGFVAVGLVAAPLVGRGLPVALRLAAVAAAAAALVRWWPGRRQGALIACAAAALDLGLAGKELVPRCRSRAWRPRRPSSSP